MKKIVLSSVLSLIITFSFAQKLAEKDVPDNVKNAFKAKFPEAVVLEWSKDSADTEAAFVSNEMKTEATFDGFGNWKETEWEMPTEYVPDTITGYVLKNYKDYKIKEFSMTDSPSGKSYVVEIQKKKDAMELYFAIAGEFQKKVAAVIETKKKK
ncbi:MAG: PepSY-like domain-containing protein [Bacteroidetes bacterium]|nr:PepSY-like domain-containing protein [Bacteroidota bacterium]